MLMEDATQLSKCLSNKILGLFIEKIIGQLDFSDDALFRVALLMQQYEDVGDELDPNQEIEDDDNTAALNITFFLYVIKDALDYCGLSPPMSKTRQIKNALYKFDLLTAKNEDF